MECTEDYNKWLLYCVYLHKRNYRRSALSPTRLSRTTVHPAGTFVGNILHPLPLALALVCTGKYTLPTAALFAIAKTPGTPTSPSQGVLYQIQCSMERDTMGRLSFVNQNHCRFTDDIVNLCNIIKDRPLFINWHTDQNFILESLLILAINFGDRQKRKNMGGISRERFLVTP